MPWVNEKDFKELPIFDQLTCNTIMKWRRRKIIRPLVRKESDGTYSVNVDEKSNKSIHSTCSAGV